MEMLLNKLFSYLKNKVFYLWFMFLYAIALFMRKERLTVLDTYFSFFTSLDTSHLRDTSSSPFLCVLTYTPFYFG